jgi:dTDP-4-dehydrorhamnose 3,5-epimerase
MKATPQEIPDVLLLEPRIFRDDRGYFLETYSTRSFPGQNSAISFVQDNLSYSSKGTLRGLHLQHPSDQGKLVMAVTGTVWDVAVDVRVGSPTFGRWVAQTLDDQERKQFYIPPGFAHGFCVLSETAHVFYKCTDLYNQSAELGLRFDDPDIGITWPIDAPKLSPKDEQAPFLRDIPKEKLPQYHG